MSKFIDYPTCFACRSIELEIVSNDEFGPMTMCGECGHSWISSFDEINSTIFETIVVGRVA
ncbi:MAG: hypothetical protein WCH42_07460 [Actinomycetes bacterium]|jgi:hypothetical protein